jgi:hypothetical protein
VSGGSQSGKSGLVAYTEKVSATMAWLHGRTMMHSTHSLNNTDQTYYNNSNNINMIKNL